MDRLQAYDSTSSASEESDNELDPHQGEILKKSKRKITEIEGNFAHNAEVVKQPEDKRPSILNRSREPRDASLHNDLSKRTPNNVHKYLKSTPAKCEAGLLDSVCDDTSVQNCNDNKASVPYSTRIVNQPSSRSVGRSIKPYIPKREREKESAITAPLCAQTNISEIECGPKIKEVNSKPNNGESNERKPILTCRPPKKLHLELQSHSQGVNCVRWNPTKSSLLLSASMDHVVCIWDTQGGGACIRRLTGHTEAVKDSKWSLCGEQVLSCGYDKTARLTELQTGQEIQKFSNKDYVTCVQFHPTNPSVFLAGTFKSAILCWDTRTGNVESKYTACFGQVQDLAFLPGGEEFISAAEVIRRNSTDKGIMVWDFRSTAVLSNQIYQEAFTCTSLRVHPHESHFVAQSNGDYIALFSTRKPYKLNKFKRYQGHKVSGYHIGCDFSPDGSIVCSGSADGNMFFYNHHTSQVIKTLDAHTAPCMDIAYHPSLPSCVASCGWDGQVKVWT